MDSDRFTADKLLGRTYLLSGMRVQVVALGLLPKSSEEFAQAWGIRLWAAQTGSQWVPLADFVKAVKLGAVEECA